MNDDKCFGKRLKELREGRGLTQEQLGELFNLSKQSISTYEKGNSKPKQHTLIAFAEYFGVTSDYLLCRTDDPTPPGKSTRINFDEYVLQAQTLADSLLRIAELDDKYALDEETFMRLSQLAHGKHGLTKAKGADKAAGGVKSPNTGALDGDDSDDNN